MMRRHREYAIATSVDPHHRARMRDYALRGTFLSFALCEPECAITDGVRAHSRKGRASINVNASYAQGRRRESGYTLLMRIVTLLSWAAIVLGAAGIFAGHELHVPRGVDLGVFMIGAGFALGGMESLLTRRISFRSSSDAGEHYAGAPAVIWGLMALLIGAAAIGAAYLMRAGLWRATINQLVRHPGLAWAVIGLLLAGAGALLMVHPDRRRSLARTLFIRYPTTLIGMAIVLAGVLVTGIGLWEWHDPHGFNHYVGTTHDVPLHMIREAWATFVRHI